ncbi:site-specific DNA-methyltransferase [Corynebacterium auriscanis]|uniref:site-specific DNA-methyltransferase n=1 Tax=Corynebacterium auriscanis TaxID=99807 RepID=UPI003CF2E64F
MNEGQKTVKEELEIINEVANGSPDFRTELAEQLAELAPEVIADGKIDVEKLKELLQGDASDTSERFGLFWPGKKRAIRAAQTPTTATLRPDKENSKDWDTTKNVFIEGDNLEVLKILQKHYHGKIKMIYIDPPYNTGKDFVYPDNFKEGLESYLEWSKQVNEEGKKLSSNSESEGRYHSNWLNMMYPRLKLARNLLSDDGVIVMSIDDSEFANLSKLGAEIFGESRFAANIIWKKRNTPPNDRAIGAQHDYLIAFTKRDLSGVNLRPRSKDQIAKYRNPDNHPKGPWVAGDLSANVKGGRYVESLCYPVINPNTEEKFYPPNMGNWRFSQEKMAELLKNDEIYFGKDGKGSPKLKRFLSAVKPGTTWTTLWDFAPFNTDGSNEMKQLFANPGIFESPKPVDLLVQLLQLGTDPDSVILDFFAGSASTAHAVLKLNAQDGGNRNFIMVQLPEPTSSKSEARKAGFDDIATVSRERIYRAERAVKDSLSNELRERKVPLDVGFRAYKLADTNFTKWRTESDTDATELEQHLLDLRESADDNATPDDLLTEILIKQGHSLVEQIRDREIDGLSFKAVVEVDDEADKEDTLVLAYLDEHTKPTLSQLRAAVDVKPAQFIILEDAFKGDDELKTNLAQICKTNGIELWTA